MSSAPQGHVVARIGKAHGLRGEVTVETRTDDPERRFRPGVTFGTVARTGSGVPRSLTLATARLHRMIWLLSFDGIPDRTGAEGLRDTLLTVSAADAATGEGADDADDEGWYEEDLVGLEVVTADGDLVGTVTGLELGPQDRLVVAVEGGVVRIPFVEEIVPEIDEDTRRVVVAPPAGLLELVEDE